MEEENRILVPGSIVTRNPENDINRLGLNNERTGLEIKETYNTSPTPNSDNSYEQTNPYKNLDNEYDNELIDESTINKAKSLFPPGFTPAGDIDNRDIFPDKDRPVVAGYTTTPSWGSQPLWDIGVRYPLAIHFKKKRAIQELMLAQLASKSAKEPTSVTPEKVTAAAPNFMKTNADIFTARTSANYQEAELKRGSPAYAYKDAKYLSRHNKAVADENALALQSLKAYEDADKVLTQSADGKYFLPDETVSAARQIRNNTNYDFQDAALKELGSKVNDPDALANYYTNWYDDKMSKIRRGATLSDASQKILKDLDPDVTQRFNNLTPEEKAKYDNSFVMFYKTNEHQEVTPERVKALAAAVAEEQGVDFYVSDPTKTEKENKEAARKAGKIWTDTELAQFVTNKLGIKDKEGVVPVFKDKGKTIVINPKDENAVPELVTQEIEHLVTGDKKTIQLNDNTSVTVGSNYFRIFEDGILKRTIAKADADGIANAIVEYQSKGKDFGGISYQQANLALSKSDEWRKQVNELVKDKYNPDSSYKAIKNKPITEQINWNVKEGGEIPIEKNVYLTGAVNTGTQKEPSFSLKMKVGNSDLSGLVIIPKNFVVTTENRLFPDKDVVAVGSENQIARGKYVETKDGNFKVVGLDGKEIRGGTGAAIPLDKDYVSGTANPGFNDIFVEYGKPTYSSQRTGTGQDVTKGVGTHPYAVILTKEDESKVIAAAKAGGSKLSDADILKHYRAGGTYKQQVDAWMVK